MSTTLHRHGGGCVGCINAECDALDPTCSQCGVTLGLVDRPTDPRDPWACADCLRAATPDWSDDCLSPVRFHSEDLLPGWFGENV